MNRSTQPPLPANRLTRFSDRVDAYAKHRPSYPAEAIDAVLRGLRAPETLTILDVGAGTGISSRLLAARGCRVVALEPNEAMRAAGAAQPDNRSIRNSSETRAFEKPLLSESSSEEADASARKSLGIRISWTGGTGEATGQPNAAFDAVTCFQAFHWLQHDRALAEFARVLKPAGRAALVWNVRDESDPFTKGYGRIILAHATEPPTSPALSAHGLIPEAFRARWTGYRLETSPSEQSMDREGLIGRATSASYCPNAGPPLAALRHELGNLFDEHSKNGRVTLRYRCEVHLATAP